MTYEETDLKGKLKLLVNEFEKAKTFDASDLKVLIQHLHYHKWDSFLCELSLKVDGFHDYFNEDYFNQNHKSYIKELIEDRIKSIPEPNLSDNQKMDILIQFYEDGWYEIDKKTLVKLTNRLKTQELNL